MKKSALILILVVTTFSIGTILYFKYQQEQKEKKVYVLYDPVQDMKIDWEQYEHLFPAGFEPTLAVVEIGELLKLNEQQKEMYDSIQNDYYSQLHLKRSDSGNRFYLPLSPITSINFREMGSVRRISEDELPGFNLISLDSLVKITPGLEYFQLKNKNNVEKTDNLSFHIIEKVPESELARIYRVRPIVEEYD